MSAPVTWEELTRAAPEDFTVATTPARFAEVGDRHAAIDDVAHSLQPAEREQAHRHQLETRLLVIDQDAVPRSFESHRRACGIAVAVGLVHLAVMVVAILEGYGTAGTAGAALGMAAVAWATRPPGRPRAHRRAGP